MEASSFKPSLLSEERMTIRPAFTEKLVLLFGYPCQELVLKKVVNSQESIRAESTRCVLLPSNLDSQGLVF
jgi:hypothetical protein